MISEGAVRHAMNRIVVAALGLAVVLSAAPTQAQTARQRGAIEAAAGAEAFATICTRARVDYAVLAGHLNRAGVRAADIAEGGRFHPVAVGALKDVKATLAGREGPEACVVARLLYGEGGTSVPGLMVTR